MHVGSGRVDVGVMSIPMLLLDKHLVMESQAKTDMLVDLQP